MLHRCFCVTLLLLLLLLQVCRALCCCVVGALLSSAALLGCAALFVRLLARARVRVVQARELAATSRGPSDPSPPRAGGSGGGAVATPFCQPQASVVLRNRFNGNASRELRTKIADGVYPVRPRACVRASVRE